MSEEGVMTDPERGNRTGMPEVVFAQGKSEEKLLAAVETLLDKHPVLVTKASEDQCRILKEKYPNSLVQQKMGVAVIGGVWKEGVGRCMIITAGTSDVPIAEEAALSLEYLGIEPIRAYDRGVAGIHRMQDAVDLLQKEPAIGVIVVAGMEGALPSVVAGQLKQPVVAVPTSVGYGSSFEGMAALLGMLNSCVPGITVVNIDNGFGAAAAIYRMMTNWTL